MNLIEGKLIPPVGFSAAGISSGLKPDGQKDLALVVSDRPAVAAGMFTTNLVQAAPLQVNRDHLQDGLARAVLVNSKNANACTGKSGLADARKIASQVATGLGISADEVLVNSTGVIGVPLPMEILQQGIQTILPKVSDGWDDAAEAIMTTDTVPKKATAQLQLSGNEITLCGIAKGAGMIAPNMATMLGFVFTDASLDQECLVEGLKQAVSRSFNCITVDGDMSTNDTVLILANGAACTSPLVGEDLTRFQEALTTLCASLAKQIARDGEGATKLITIQVSRAANEADARTVGLSIANSNLVKTAVFGRDPNWGRILCAVGYSGAVIDPEEVTVSMAGIPIYERGSGLPFDHEGAVEALGSDSIDIEIDLACGNSNATIYTCDLSYDYVRINAEYTT